MDIVARGIEFNGSWAVAGNADVASSAAQDLPLPDESCSAFVTDHPYCNAIPYADLADFYAVWLARLFGKSKVGSVADSLSPKGSEIVEMAGWDDKRYPHKSKEWYECEMALALHRGRLVTKPDGVMVVVFSHKETHAWEALLSAVVSSGWTITSSWPINTENATRLRTQSSATLGRVCKLCSCLTV